MTQSMTPRPRVAAIGLQEDQIPSILPLCGDLRTAASLEGYLNDYSWTETDMIILGDGVPVADHVHGHVLTINPPGFTWTGYSNLASPLCTHPTTERELQVTATCPERYRHLAEELASQLRRAESPPSRFDFPEFPQIGESTLIETTSQLPVASRWLLKNPTAPRRPGAVALALPSHVSLSAWFRAFLDDIHELDPARVPQAPPRLGHPSDWYTPEERHLADQIEEITAQVEGLQAEQEQVKGELVAESEKADAGIRRAIWADGDDLVAAVGDILTELGLDVRHMDAEQKEGKPKREDLRLTLAVRSGWEAIAEVKGYSRGTRTNDVRQIREHRDHYIEEEGRSPDLTLWIANPHRGIDPSSRTAPGNNVGESAAIIEAVHVLTTDLYKLWTLVATGRLEKAQAVQQLIDATPGLWCLQDPGP